MQIVDGKSILSYTLSLPLGEQRKIYIGGSVTDLPGDYCKYSEAGVCKLNNTFAQIVIHPRNSGPIECTNTFNGTTWEGWRFGLSNADIADSGWKNISLTSDFKLYTNSSARYRKIGNLVELRGVIAPTKSISADSLTVAFTLPSGYRPTSLVSDICQGSGSNRWLLSIEASGNAVVSRYGITEYIAIPTTAWLPFHAIYYVD